MKNIVELAKLAGAAHHVYENAPGIDRYEFTSDEMSYFAKLIGERELLTDAQICEISRRFLDHGFFPWEGPQPWVYAFARAVQKAQRDSL